MFGTFYKFVIIIELQGRQTYQLINFQPLLIIRAYSAILVYNDLFSKLTDFWGEISIAYNIVNCFKFLKGLPSTPSKRLALMLL